MHESDFYFGFEWIVGEPGAYFAFRDTAARCGCEIVELKAVLYRQAGFDVIPFVIRASAVTNLTQFRKIVGEERLLNWKPSTKVVFKSGRLPMTKEQLGTLPGEQPMRWLDNFRASARHNQKFAPKAQADDTPNDTPPSTDLPPNV